MAYTGARRGELLAIRWADFDGKAITISKSRIGVTGGDIETGSTKGGEGQRRVTLDPDTIEQFNSFRKKLYITLYSPLVKPLFFRSPSGFKSILKTAPLFASVLVIVIFSRF